MHMSVRRVGPSWPARRACVRRQGLPGAGAGGCPLFPFFLFLKNFFYPSFFSFFSLIFFSSFNFLSFGGKTSKLLQRNSKKIDTKDIINYMDYNFFCFLLPNYMDFNFFCFLLPNYMDFNFFCFLLPNYMDFNFFCFLLPFPFLLPWKRVYTH